MMTIYWVPRAGYGARGAGQARGKNSPKLGNTLEMASLVQDRSKLQPCVTPQRGETFRASNEGSPRFHNHGEGPYYDLLILVESTRLS